MLISSVGLPFTRINILPPHAQTFILFTQTSHIPTLLIIYTKNPQSTESYAFSKSTLRTKHSRFNFFAKFTTSLTTSTLSTKCRPFTKADREVDMIELISFDNLTANTFDDSSSYIFINIKSQSVLV